MSVWGDVDHLNCRVFSSSLEDLPLEVVLRAFQRLNLKLAAAPEFLPGEILGSQGHPQNGHRPHGSQYAVERECHPLLQKIVDDLQLDRGRF